MRKTIQMLTVITITGLMAFGFFAGVPGLTIPRVAGAGPAFDYVVTVLMENNGYCDVMATCGGGGPYQTTLAQQYSIAGNCQSNSACSSGGYTATVHPSEGNYVALIGGDDYGFTSDCGYCPARTNALNLIDRIEASGRTWNAWFEGGSGGGTCSARPPRGGDHYAFITFTDIQTNPARCAHLVSTTSSTDTQFLAEVNSANPSNYIWLTPDDSNNCHDTPMSFCDAYLATLVPKILSSTLFTTKNAALFIVYDEGSGTYPSDFVYATWAGPNVKRAYVGTGSYTHYSYLKTLETVWNMPSLTSNDATASAMTEFFGSSGPVSLSTSFTVSTNPIVNLPVTFTSATLGGTAPYTVTWNFGDGSSGTGTLVTHTYATAQSYTVTETAKDSSTPQQTTVSTNTVTVSTPQTGNFGSCNSLPQGWNCGNTNGLTGSSVNIVNGVLQTRESNPGVGNDNSYYYSTSQKGTFPWSPCQAPANGALPSTISSVSTTFTPLTITPSGAYRYHIYVALYYWLPNGAVTAGGSTYRCLDTQVRIENIGGAFSPVGSTSTYNPGDSFGWDQITIGSVSTGQTYTLTADVQQQCQQTEAAWGIPTSTPCQLAGIEIGTEGFQFQTVNVDWTTVTLSTTNPLPLSTSFNFLPSTPVAGQSVSFSGSAAGGTAPYTYAWTLGDGGTASGSTVSHAYSTPGTYNVKLTVTDNSRTSASTTQTITVAPTPPSPIQASFTLSPTSVPVGQTVTFTGTATGGTQPYSYSWNFGDGTTASGAIAAHAYSTAGTFTITLTVTDSTSQTSSSSNNIIVSPLPTPDFTVNASPTSLSVQAGNSAAVQVQLVSLNGFAGTVLLTATVTPTGPSPSLTQASLTLGSGGSGSSSLIVSTATSTRIGIYDVSVSAGSGSTTHTVHITLSVTAIPPPPDFALSVSQSTLTIQAGRTKGTVVTLTSLNGFSGTILITATSSSGLNFSLTQGVVTLSPGSSQTLTLTVGVLPATQAGVYSITVYAASGSLQDSTSLTIKATHNNRPSVKVPGPKATITGSAIQFVVTATDPDQGDTITLSVTDLPLGASFDPATGTFTWTPLPGQVGIYNVTFIATDNGYPPMSDGNFVIITVEGGTQPPSTQGQGICLLCQITQTAKTDTWLLVTGILAGFMLTLTVVYIRARGRLQEARRMRRLTRYS